MADTYNSGSSERDIEQAVTALKKGATLLKYGRIGKPKFCPFRLSNDESTLIWYSGKEEKQLKLCQVSRIVPGQRTAIFQRYPRPDKEYQSFSLIYGDRSLDLICKDKDEAEIWFIALKALISGGSWRKWRNEARESSISTDGSSAQQFHQSLSALDAGDSPHQVPHDHQVPHESSPPPGLGKAFSDIMLYTATSQTYNQVESSTSPVSLPSTASIDNSTEQSSTSDNFRVSLSSVVSSSSQGSCPDDFDSLGDVFIWREGIGEGILGGGTVRVSDSFSSQFDALLPKALASTVGLDVHHVACGARHAALITKQGEIFSWGEESGGRLGHGVEVDVSHPKLIDALSGLNIELVACGEHHTCAITISGDLFTWGDGTYNSGILGHGNMTSHWIPKRVCGPLNGMHVSYVSCGPWHTAAMVSTGQLFTFGDGTFGVLGHGDRTSSTYPREVAALRGLQTLQVACGAWHTAAIVDVQLQVHEASTAASYERCSLATGKLFTWGEGGEGQLGHDDKEARLLPEYVAALVDVDLCKVACGCELTVALTTSGRVYTMGRPVYGQLGCPEADGRTPVCVEGKIADSFIEDIACGSYHVAVLTSKGELFTWGKGVNGQLGHGDNGHRNEPTYVSFMKDKQVRSVSCGSNFTAAVCPHKWVGADHSACTGCHNPFGFRRKRHYCYNCGQVFCRACSSHKSLKASLAPNMDKAYRVCDDCFIKLKKAMEPRAIRIPRPGSKNAVQKSNGGEKETIPPKLASLSFVNSMKITDSGLFSDAVKLGRVARTVSSIPNENFQSGSCHQLSPLTPLFGASNKRVSASASSSRLTPRPVSLGSQWCGPARSSTLVTSLSVPSLGVSSPSSKHTEDDLRREVILLKGEVAKLSSSNKLLEAELEKTRKELKKAKATAADEAAKSKAAKEVIKSLTAQLKEMAENSEEGNKASCKSDSHFGQYSGSTNNVSHDDHVTSLPKSESNMTCMDAILSNGANTEPDKAEYVVQEEPGVYITLSSLAGGGNELRRVRFSRKRFSQEQAQKWWAENSNGVYERHNIRSQ